MISGIESDTLLNLNGSNNNACITATIHFPTERIDYYFSPAIKTLFPRRSPHRRSSTIWTDQQFYVNEFSRGNFAQNNVRKEEINSTIIYDTLQRQMSAHSVIWIKKFANATVTSNGATTASITQLHVTKRSMHKHAFDSSSHNIKQPNGRTIEYLEHTNTIQALLNAENIYLLLEKLIRPFNEKWLAVSHHIVFMNRIDT